MVKKMINFINPKIISHTGESHLYGHNRLNFLDEHRSQIEKYPNAIYVAVTDQNCHSGCPADCKSKLDAYYYKDGVYIEREQSNWIGQGASGSVFVGRWHGHETVFKFIKIDLDGILELREASKHASDLYSRLTEINKVPDSSNILKPLGHFRQQEQNLDESTGKYTAHNSEVFVFKKCRMDLEHFKNKEYSKLQDKDCTLLLNIMKQCLER